MLHSGLLVHCCLSTRAAVVLLGFGPFVYSLMPLVSVLHLLLSSTQAYRICLLLKATRNTGLVLEVGLGTERSGGLGKKILGE